MGKSKIIFNGQTLIDLTGDTVTAETLLEGITAHGADGEAILGVMEAAAGGGITVLSGTVTPTSAQRAELNVALPKANFMWLFMAPDSSITATGAASKITSLCYISNNDGSDVFLQTWKSTTNNTANTTDSHTFTIDHETGTIKFASSIISLSCFYTESTYRWYYAYG